jgi:ABC-type transporter MlaC component
MAKLRSSSLVALFLVIFLGSVALGQAADAGGFPPPLEVVRSSNEAILDILANNPVLEGEAEQRVYELMDEVTDFRRMADVAIGDLCHESAEKCEEWNQVFGDLLRIRSLKGVGRYRADRFDYLGEETDGDTAVVNTLAYFEGDDLTLDYELELTGNGWVIVNYIVDDVDTVRNYNRRFQRLLQEESVDDVIRRLRESIAEHEAET